MSTFDADKIAEKVTKGVLLAVQRMIEQAKRDDGDLVVSRNGKVVTIKARDLKSK